MGLGDMENLGKTWGNHGETRHGCLEQQAFIGGTGAHPESKDPAVRLRQSPCGQSFNSWVFAPQAFGVLVGQC